MPDYFWSGHKSDISACGEPRLVTSSALARLSRIRVVHRLRECSQPSVGSLDRQAERSCYADLIGR